MGAHPYQTTMGKIWPNNLRRRPDEDRVLDVDAMTDQPVDEMLSKVASGSFSCRASRHNFRVGPCPLVHVRRVRPPRRAEDPSEVGRAVRVL